MSVIAPSYVSIMDATIKGNTNEEFKHLYGCPTKSSAAMPRSLCPEGTGPRGVGVGNASIERFWVPTEPNMCAQCT